MFPSAQPVARTQETRAALYARISTGDGRQFAENQIAELRRYTERQGWQIVREYIDKLTGSEGPKVRTQLARLMEDAHQRRFDVVLVFSLDRLTREGVWKAFEYLERLKASGVEFRSITEEHFQTSGPAGELFLAVAAWIAKQERALMIQRIRAGIARARADGKPLGRPRRVVDLARLSQLRSDGLPIRAIAKVLRVSKTIVDRNLAELAQKRTHQPIEMVR